MKKVDGYKLNFTNKIKKTVLKEIHHSLKSGNLATGKFVERFEKKFSELHKVKYAVACSSGGSALEIIFKALDLKNKEVLVPSNTFIATFNSIKSSGAIPKFIDTEKDSLMTSLNEIKKRVTSKTKCICLVHIGSYIQEDIFKIVEFCKKKKIHLVEDCAHAVLTSFKNKFAGNFGVAGAFSFYATKSVTSGEGGMITTNNRKLFRKIKSMTSYGMTKSYGNYEYKYFSSNYRMNEAEAIIGYNHLINYSIYYREKNKIKKIYDNFLEGKIKLFKTKSKGNLYKYICILDSPVQKSKLRKLLNRNGIFLSGDVYSKPLHKSKIIKPYVKYKLKNTIEICSKHICLPIYLGLSEKKIHRICNLILNFLKQNNQKLIKK